MKCPPKSATTATIPVNAAQTASARRRSAASLRTIQTITALYAATMNDRPYTPARVASCASAKFDAAVYPSNSHGKAICGVRVWIDSPVTHKNGAASNANLALRLAIHAKGTAKSTKYSEDTASMAAMTATACATGNGPY